jgi:hypothetical protein
MGEKQEINLESKWLVIPVGIGRKYLPNASPKGYWCRAVVGSMVQLTQRDE